MARLARLARLRLASLCGVLVGALLLAEAPVAAAGLELVGAADPGTAGFNAMAVGLDGYAYLGSWGSSAECPAVGARVFDARDPARPTLVASAAAYPGTTAEHLAAVHLDSAAFSGSVLLVGIQRCSATSGTAGLALWDVGDPTAPRELGFFDTGRGARGVHELAVGKQGDHWYAYLAVPNSEVVGGPGDLRIVDVTDPANPTAVADWGARRDADLPVGNGRACAPVCRGAIPGSFLHSVSLAADARTAYLSYWDLGMIVLDVSEPRAPRLVGHYSEPEAAEGDTHSAAVTNGGTLALVTDETVGPPWGNLRLVDLHDPANPVQVGTYDTPDSAAGTPGGAYAYSAHNALVDARYPNQVLLAWYSDGVRLLDIADPSAPVERATWVPPRNPYVWSVQPMGDLLVVGDINNGLFLLKRPVPPAA